MENETNNELDEELIEQTKGLEPQDGSLEEDKFEDIGEIKHEEPQVPEVDLKTLPKGLKYEFFWVGQDLFRDRERRIESRGE
jgi:hypothetical protein